MSYWSAGYNSYPEYLQSPHFLHQREIAWQKSNKCCEFCFIRFGLAPHHKDGYDFIGAKDEWKTLRFLCETDHHRVHFVFWFIRLPLKRWVLVTRYYQIKIFFWLVRAMTRAMLPRRAKLTKARLYDTL